MELLQNFLDLKSSSSSAAEPAAAAVYMTRRIGEVLDGSEDILSAANGPPGFLDKPPSSQSWSYGGTVGGDSGTLVSNSRRRRRKTKAKERMEEARKWWMRRNRPDLEPWKGTKAAPTPDVADRERNLGRSAQVNLTVAGPDGRDDPSAVGSSHNLDGTSAPVDSLSDRLWHRRWANLKYMDYLPAAASSQTRRRRRQRVKAFQGPRLDAGSPPGETSSPATSTRRPNVFFGEDWVDRLRDGEGSTAGRRRTPPRLKYVPVFGDAPSSLPYYKSVVVDEEGEDEETDPEEEPDGEVEEDHDEDEDADYYDDKDYEYLDDDDYYDEDDDDIDDDEDSLQRLESRRRGSAASDSATGGTRVFKIVRGKDGRYRAAAVHGGGKGGSRTRRKKKRRRNQFYEGAAEIHLHIQQPRRVFRRPRLPQIHYVDAVADSRQSSHWPGGGVRVVGTGDTSGGLLALLPLVLVGGLAFGFLALNSTGSGTTVSNVISVNGSTITNTFTPTNTATATNTNNDQDTITNTNTNTNNPPGRRRRSVKRHYRNLQRGTTASDTTWTEYAARVRQAFFSLLGTSSLTFYDDFLRSTHSVRPGEVIEQMTALARKMSCVESTPTPSFSDASPFGEEEGACADRVVCEHLSEDHALYRNNMIVRAGEVFLVTLSRYSTCPNATTADDVSALIEMAAAEECHAAVRCSFRAIEECLAIM